MNGFVMGVCIWLEMKSVADTHGVVELDLPNYSLVAAKVSLYQNALVVIESSCIAAISYVLRNAFKYGIAMKSI
jgi:hypothetical protein